MSRNKDGFNGKEEKTDISVIIPVYNQESEIERSILDLLRGQTALCRIEILLINDGSADRSGEICRRLADKFPEIQYFEQENRGVSAARNSECEGKIFVLYGCR